MLVNCPPMRRINFSSCSIAGSLLCNRTTVLLHETPQNDVKQNIQRLLFVEALLWLNSVTCLSAQLLQQFPASQSGVRSGRG